jgi:hypothetical protein
MRLQHRMLLFDVDNTILVADSLDRQVKVDLV